MKSFKWFVRSPRGTNILSICNGLSCSLRDVIDQLKDSYQQYKKEYPTRP